MPIVSGYIANYAIIRLALVAKISPSKSLLSGGPT